MLYLFSAALIWSFSFGLIKAQLASLNPAGVAVIRLAFSLLLFLPFLRISGITWGQRFSFMAIGSIQYGVMYIAYLSSFRWLTGFEVAMLTITTPFWVSVFDDLLHLKLSVRRLFLVLFSVVGAALVVSKGKVPDRLFMGQGLGLGIMLVQLSNLCFAAGQVLYRRVKMPLTVPDHSLFAWLYFGAFLSVLFYSMFQSSVFSVGSLTSSQWLSLLYLGTVASGLAFFLWNKGTTRTDIATLALFNNVKIPLAAGVGFLFFHEEIGLIQSLIGFFIIFITVYISKGASD